MTSVPQRMKIGLFVLHCIAQNAKLKRKISRERYTTEQEEVKCHMRKLFQISSSKFYVFLYFVFLELAEM